MRSTPLPLVLSFLLVSCVGSDAPDCGSGSAYETNGHVLCMYQQPVLIEEGFSCPPDAGEFTSTDGGGVCAPENFGGDPMEAWEDWAAQDPGENQGTDWDVREDQPDPPDDDDDRLPIQNGDEVDPAFEEVAAILRQNCALGGCHGNPPGAAAIFLLPTGSLSTDGEIATALSSTTPTNSGNPLISPGRPEISEIYVRITKPFGDIQLMGAGTYGQAATRLQQEEIDAIEAWILNGATFVAE